MKNILSYRRARSSDSKEKKPSKGIIAIGIVLCAFLAAFAGISIFRYCQGTHADVPTKQVSYAGDFCPRTIVTTDGECDDLNSMIRLLLYANEMDIRGIVLTSSCYHYAGDPNANIEPYRWAGEAWLWEYLDAYEKVYKNLSSHDPNYPTPQQLRDVTKIGNIDTVSDTARETEGSRLIEQEILSSETSVLYLQCWGGSNTVARALMSIEERYAGTEGWEAKKAGISEKLVIYLISTQDDTYETYISTNWPEITVLHNKKSFEALGFNWRYVLKGSQSKTMQANWQKEHILKQDNPLMELYFTYWDDKAYVGELPQYQYGVREYSLKKLWRTTFFHGGFFSYGDFLSEGDSPAFLFLLDDDLKSGNIEAALNNWGGLFRKVSDHYYVDDHHPADSIGRYLDQINEDFAKRICWTESAS